MADIVQTVFSSSDSRPEKFNSIEEVLEFYYRDLFGNNGYIAPFTGVSDKVERKLNNSIKSVANSQVEPEHVLLFYDATLFGAADNGFLFTGDAVFYCQFGGYSVKFPYSEIKKIEYVKNTVTGDSGKKKIQETTTVYYDSRKFVIEQSYISDPEKFIEMFDYLKQVTIRNYARKDSGICGSCSEEKSKIDFFDDLPSEIQITYLKIIINFCLAGNEKTNQKIFSSLFRLTAKLKLGAAEREAVFKYMDSLQDTFTLSQSIFEKFDAEKRAVLKYSILKDLVFMHLSLKGRDPGSNVFIRDFINHYQLQSGAVELFVMMHDCGKNIADVTGDDSAVENNLRMIAQKASECDVPPASLFFTGGAVLDIDATAAGLAAFGLSGLSGACRRQDPFCSVAMIGIGSRQSIGNLTGVKEIEGRRKKELLLNLLCRHLRMCSNLIMQEILEISEELNSHINENSDSSCTVGENKIFIGKKTALLNFLAGCNAIILKDLETSDIRACSCAVPHSPDPEKINAVTSEPTARKFRDLVLKCYDSGERGYTLRQDLNSDEIHALKNALVKLGYYSAGTVLKNTTDKALSKLGSFFRNT